MQKQKVDTLLKLMLFSFIVVLVSAVAGTSAHAETKEERAQRIILDTKGGCTKYTDPKIEFRKIKGGVFFSPALTETALASQKARLFGRKMPERQGNVGQPTIWHHALVSIDKFPTTGCVYLKNLRLDYRIDHNIYIAGEYPKGSCLYDSFYELEMELIQLDDELITEYMQKVQAYLESVPDDLRASGPNPRARIIKMEEEHREKVENVIRSLFLQLEKDLLVQRRDADDPKFYYDILKECGAELPGSTMQE